MFGSENPGGVNVTIHPPLLLVRPVSGWSMGVYLSDREPGISDFIIQCILFINVGNSVYNFTDIFFSTKPDKTFDRF